MRRSSAHGRAGGYVTGCFWRGLCYDRFQGRSYEIDKKKLIIFANVLGVIVNAGYALSSGIALFVLFRILNGVQFSIIGSLNMTIAGDSLPKNKLGSGMGVFGVGSAVAMAIGPSIGLALKNFGTNVSGIEFGYTLVFAFSSFVMLLSLIPSFLVKPVKHSKEVLATTGLV
jgi:MFS family permease